MASMWNVARRELARVFKDKRVVFSSLIFPAISIVIIYLIVGQFFIFNEVEQQLYDGTVYVENITEDLAEYIDTNYPELNVITLLSEGLDSGDVKDDILSRDEDLLVVFDPDFQDKIDSYESPTYEEPLIEMYFNNINNSSVSAFNTFSHIMTGYRDFVIGERLGGQGYVDVFNFAYIELADEEERSRELFSYLLPIIIVTILFSAGINLGADSVAGEKERGTLATIMASPVSVLSIAAGKSLGLGIISLASAASSFAAIILTTFFAFSKQSSFIELPGYMYGVAEVAILMLLVSMLALIFSGIILFISTYSRTVKEANTWLTPAFIAIMTISFIAPVLATSSSIHYFIPIYNILAALKSLIFLELTTLNLAITIAVSIVFKIILVCGLCFLLGREKTIFKRW